MIMLLIWKDFYATTFANWFVEESTQIAMFHTCFNVICTVLFLPFIKLLVKAATILVPEKKKKETEGVDSLTLYMDKRFLETPAVAIGQLTKEVFRMADMSMESLQIAFDGFINRDIDAVERVSENNERVMKLGEKISDYLVQISARNTTLADEKQVSALHNNVGDVARVAELADNLTKYTTREVRENLIFSDGINEKISSMHDLLRKQYALVKQVILENDYAALAESDDVEEMIDNMRRDLVAEHILRLAQGKCRPENNTIFINLVSNLERIGDHLNFIAHSADGVK